MSPTDSPESTVSDFVAALRNSVSFSGFVNVPADKTFFNSKGGNIGLWMVNASNAFLNDFGGVTFTP